jgi:Flp pilus assembly protein TadG
MEGVMQTDQIHQRLTGLRNDESGSMAVIVALLLVALLSISALAIDYGHMSWVQNELKNAADAGALAGARLLMPYTGSPAAPNWLAAQTKAAETVRLNAANGQTLTTCQVECGYWSSSTKTLQLPDITPTSTDFPAVQVRVAKAAGENNGALKMLFAPVFGVMSQDLSGRSIALVSGPSSIPPGGNAFPMALPKSLADKWNQEPYSEIYIGSSYHDTDGGQWTSFLIDANDVPTIRDLIADGNPSTLKIGDNIWIEPGTKTTLYDDAATKIGQTVIVPIVETDFATHAYTPILGFASFYIQEALGGSDKYIKGYFVPNFNIGEAGSGGPVFGTFPKSAKLIN